MYVVIVKFVTHPEYRDAFRTRVKQQAEDSLRLEPDCHVFDVCTDPEQADFVLLYEVYSDRQAFDTHLESAHFADFNNEVQSWIRDKQVSTLTRI